MLKSTKRLSVLALASILSVAIVPAAMAGSTETTPTPTPTLDSNSPQPTEPIRTEAISAEEIERVRQEYRDSFVPEDEVTPEDRTMPNDSVERNAMEEYYIGTMRNSEICADVARQLNGPNSSGHHGHYVCHGRAMWFAVNHW